MSNAPAPLPVWSQYDPPPGTDPDWDRFLATFTARARVAAADTARQRSALDTDHRATVDTIEYEAPGMRKGLEASLLERGVGRSGEAIRRRADLESSITSDLTAAERARNAGIESVDSAYARILADMAAEREQAITDSRLRLLDDNKSVPGVTTPGADGGPDVVSDPYNKKKSTSGKGSGKGSVKVVSSKPTTPKPPSTPAGVPSGSTSQLVDARNRTKPVIPVAGKGKY